MPPGNTQLRVKFRAEDGVTNVARRAMASVTKFATTTFKFVQRIRSGLATLRRSIFNLRNAMIGFAAIFVGARTIGSLTSAISTIDRFAKDAKRVDLPVEDYTRLAFAANLAGVETTQLLNGIRTGQKNLVDFTRFGVGEASKGLDVLGLTLEDITGSDGQLRSLSELLPELAARFQTLRSEERTFAAQSIFGRGGFELLTLFRDGPDALREALADADRFGATITAEQAVAAERLTDSLARVDAAWLSFRANIITQVEPAVVGFLDRAALRIRNLGDVTGSSLGVIFGRADDALTGQTDAQRRQALDDLRFIGGAAVDVMKAGAIGIGSVMGQTFIESAKVGFATVAPIITGAITDAFAGTQIGNVLGIRASAASRLASVNEEFPSALQRADDTRAERISLQQNLQRLREIGFTEFDRAFLDSQSRLAVAIRAEQAAQSRLDTLQDRFRMARLELASSARSTRDAMDVAFSGIANILDVADDSATRFDDSLTELQRRLDALAARDRALESITQAFSNRFGVFPGRTAQVGASGGEGGGEGGDPRGDAFGSVFGVPGNAIDGTRRLARTISGQLNPALRETERLTPAAAFTQFLARSREEARQLADEIRTLRLEANPLIDLEAQVQRIGQLFEQRAIDPDVADQLFKARRSQMRGIRAEREDDFRIGLGFGIEQQIAQFETLGQVGSAVGERIASAFGTDVTNAIIGVVNGTQTLEEAFGNMASSVLQDIARIIIQATIMRAVFGTAENATPFGRLLGLGSGAQSGGFVTGSGVRRFAMGGRVPGYAGGGFVPGPNINRDMVPAMLSPGEFVLSRRAARAAGPDTLRAMNRGEAPGGVNISINVTVAGGGGQSAQQAQRTGRTIAEAVLAELQRSPALRSKFREAQS